MRALTLFAVLALSTTTLAQTLPSTFAPLPATARGPVIDQTKGYRVDEIGRGLYVVNNGFYLAMFLVYDKGVVAIDAPVSLGANYLKAIAEITDKPVTHVIYANADKDHVGAASVFPKNAVYIAQKEAAARLRTAKDPSRPVPTVTFDTTYTLRVGDQRLELSYKGNNHAPGNIFIYAPEQKALMLVAVAIPGFAPDIHLNSAEDVPGFLAAHDQILAYNFQTFVGGNWNRVGNRADVQLVRDYVYDLKADAQRAVQTVDFVREASKVNFGNGDPTVAVKAYFDALINACAKSNVSKWVGKLGGVDVSIRENCQSMVSS